MTIRFIKEGDWNSLIRIWKDFNASAHAHYDVPHSTDRNEVREKARQWEMVSPDREHMFFAVCLGNEMIGYCDFHRTQDGYECGYCFHSSYHRMGYARESLQALMRWISGGQNTRFTAGTAVKNIPSVKLLESLGFKKIGEEPISFYKAENGEDIYFTGARFVIDTK